MLPGRKPAALPPADSASLCPPGVYCCGPSPVKAIKEGELKLKYDVRFVFAEVNADVAYLMLQSDMSRKRTTYPTVVGKSISTKSVGRDSKEDITHHYKYREGSACRAREPRSERAGTGGGDSH